MCAAQPIDRGALMLAALVLVLLAVAGVQLRLLRGTPRRARSLSSRRAAALAQAACRPVLLVCSLARTGSEHR